MKSLEEFIELFAELFDETDTSTLTPDTRFRDLDEWSSLMALSVMAMVDDEFDIQLTGDEMRSANTINELYTIINNKL